MANTEIMEKELDPFEHWQLEKFGNILPPTNIIPIPDEFENGYDPFKSHSGEPNQVIENTNF